MSSESSQVHPIAQVLLNVLPAFHMLHVLNVTDFTKPNSNYAMKPHILHNNVSITDRKTSKLVFWNEYASVKLQKRNEILKTTIFTHSPAAYNTFLYYNPTSKPIYFTLISLFVAETSFSQY